MKDHRSTRKLSVERLESRCLLAAIVLSNWEQLLIELVNRSRADPVAEAGRHGIGLNDGLNPGTISPAAKQPLAPHEALQRAAAGHSQDMLDRDFFAHDNPDGNSPFDRIRAAGYSFSNAAENIAWSGTTATLDRDAAIFQQHAGLFQSPVHRPNILRPVYREIGAGVRHGVFTSDNNYNSSMVTEDFGTRAGNPFLTGVVFTDTLVRDQFYTIGEGIGNVNITAVHAATGDAFSSQSGPSGGYSIQVPAGVYRVTAEGAPIAGTFIVSNIVLENENRKLDFDISQSPEVVVEWSAGNISDGTTAAIDFGEVREGEPGATRVFTVRNTGSRELALGVPSLPAGFTLVESLSDSLAPGGSDTFSIRLDSTQVGAKAGPLLIATNDPDENPFDFPITGLVTSGNTPPAIGEIANQLTTRNTPTPAIGFDVDDAQTPPSALVVTVQSGNPTLVPLGNISLGGSGGNRTIVVTPSPDQIGTAMITVTVTDGRGATASEVFFVTVPGSAAWQNATDPNNVDASPGIVPLDALVIVNELNNRVISDPTTGRLPALGPGVFPPPFLDVNGDGFVTPQDVLIVINYLNTQASQAEGEGDLLGPSTIPADLQIHDPVWFDHDPPYRFAGRDALNDLYPAIGPWNNRPAAVPADAAPSQDWGVEEATPDDGRDGKRHLIYSLERDRLLAIPATAQENVEFEEILIQLAGDLHRYDQWSAGGH